MIQKYIVMQEISYHEKPFVICDTKPDALQMAAAMGKKEPEDWVIECPYIQSPYLHVPKDEESDGC